MDVNLYLHVREKEGRLYSDDVVARLPSIANNHPLAEEWRVRSISASRLKRFLSHRPKPFYILDLGCGNGWLCNLLYNSGHHVIGMDQNLYELEQAARVFSTNARLFFLQINIFSAPFVEDTFDVILFSSVIQYFQDLPALLKVAARYLKPNGEIHILDSPLYTDTELEAATHRSENYYSSLGFPQMAEQYFHHRVSELKPFKPITLYKPQWFMLRLKNFFGQVDSPFPWIMVRKENVKGHSIYG